MDPPPTSALLPKDALDYAWKSLHYHAGQRMQAFNFFLILMGGLFIGYDNACKAGTFEQAAIIAVFGAVVALTFLVLDVRNEDLVDVGREALKSIEKLPAFSECLPKECRIFLIHEDKRSFFKSHTLWLRTIHVFLLVISVVAVVSSVYKCKTVNTKPRQGGNSQMPYIKQERRDAILGGARPQDAGELNFAITVLVDNYLMDKGEIRYLHLNEVMGAMDCAKLELYRRVAAPYEDKKIAEAGDVYQALKPEKRG
jgi:hypothetical protein